MEAANTIYTYNPRPMEQAAQKVTALQLWNSELRKQLQSNLFIMGRKGAAVPISTLMKRSENAIQVAERFEITKHRVILDGMIAQLTAITNEIQVKQGELKKVMMFHFTKRNKTKAGIRDLMNRQLAYNQALLIVVNTVPPKETKPETL